MKKILFFVILGSFIVALAVTGFVIGRRQSQTETTQEVVTEPLTVIVHHPKEGEELTSAYVFDGEANGAWFFEATFPVRLVNAVGDVVGEGYAEARGDWMTDGMVPFIGTILFDSKTVQDGMMLFERANPSGLPEHAATFSVPVKIGVTDNMTYKVFFGNTMKDPQVLHCEIVYPVERTVPRSPRIALAAIDDLLYGPTEKEKTDGYTTALPGQPKIIVQKLMIEDGVARVDFNDAFNFQVGGSCRVMMIRAQVEETLKQFPTVRDVVISVNGQTELILEP